MSKKLNLELIFREKKIFSTPLASVFTARMRNSIPHNPDSVLCIILFKNVVIRFEFSDIYTLFSSN